MENITESSAPKSTDGTVAPKRKFLDPKSVAETNIVVKGLNKDVVGCEILDKFFTEKIGKVKSCKVSRTIEQEGDDFTCRSNGYGFVNFESKEDCDKAISELNGVDLEGGKLIIERYNKDVKRETKFNNLYVRGFDENFTDEQLTDMFKDFGELGSVKIMRDENGVSKKFGFVCFKELEPAAKAIAAIDGKALEDGSVMMVTKFEKKQNRWQALKKSLARSNLYVRNFDKNVTEEDLKKFFGGDSVVRNVRIMTTEVNKDGEVVKESKQFGFVSFVNPKDASDIIGRYNNEDLEFNNKQLYVNYYEDKSARKKRLANKKERTDNLLGLLDPSALGASAEGGNNNNLMEYFMQIFQGYFKNYASNPNAQYNAGGYNNFNNHHYSGANSYNYANRRGGRGGQHRNYPSHQNYGGGYHGGQAMYNRPPPRQDAHHSYAAASQGAMPPVGGVPPTGLAQAMTGMPISQPPQAPPPINTPSAMYNSTMKTIYNSADFKAMPEEAKREKVGEEIYNYVLEKAGEDNAPKITGMIIDLPFADLITSVQTYEGLQEKIQEGLDLLKDDQ